MTGRRDGRSTGSAPPIRRRLEEVADGVHAYVQPDGGWCVNNAGIVVGEDATVVVDTAATVARATLLRDAVDRVSTAGERIVVNTHHHGDHVFGNCVFGDATIVAHRRTRAEMIEGGLALTGMWPDVRWGDIRLRPPTVTFESRLDLHPGGIRTELLHVGPAHTTNDTVVWLPDERVLFAGDVAFNGVTPFVLMGSLAGSRAALARLQALDPMTVVPGHGEPGGPEILADTLAYLDRVHELAQEGRAAGTGPREVAAEADLGRFAGLLDAERLVANLVRAYAEAGPGHELGDPVDVMAAFGEMVAHHGGLPECHA